MRIVLAQMTQYLSKNPEHKYSRYAWVMDEIANEMMDELADTDSDMETLGQWFTDFGRVFAWCGSGDPAVLPESVRDFLVSQFPQEVLAIESSEASA